MTIYRCKSCGQLVEPEKNKICPACKAELKNNMVREISTERGNSSHKRRNRSLEKLIRFAIGLLFLWIFFYVFFPATMNKQKQRLDNNTQQNNPVENTYNTQSKEPEKTHTSTDESQSVKTSEAITSGKPEQVYFSKKKDFAFSTNVQKMLEVSGVDVYKFTIKEYRNGDIWINTDKVTFTPFEVITIESNDYWLLLPVTHVEAQKAYFPTAYVEDGSLLETNSAKVYEGKKPNVFAFFKNKVFEGAEMEGIIITKWTDDELDLQNVTFHYDFGDYKKIQTADGIVYEDADGNRTANYMELPHSIVFDNKKSQDVTVLRSEIVLD